jgi:DnaJ-class molecular chaperone
MEWQPYRLGGTRRGGLTGTLGRILSESIFPCAYCRGTGQQLHMRSKCPVCLGKGFVKVNPPAVICAFCRGTGESPPQSHLTCPACQGKGVISVKEPIKRCDACRGLGRVTGTQLPCMKCKGAGVVTIKRTDGSKEGKVVELWR